MKDPLVFIDGVPITGVSRVDITTAPKVEPLPVLVPGEWSGVEEWDPLVEWPLHPSSEFGGTERPIARWHNPCFERYEQFKIIGVLAFHPSGLEFGDEGISSVEFIANAGFAVAVTRPSRHPETGYWGWWIELHPSLRDELIEVRAVVHPHIGPSRILQGGDLQRVGSKTTLPTTEQSLLLWCGPPGEARTVSTAGPLTTIQAAVESLPSCDHATIYLEPGSYQTPREMEEQRPNGQGWLTISPAPGVCREQVILTEGNGPNSNHLHLVRLQDVTIDRAAGEALFKGRSSSLKLHLWLDGCDVRGPGKLVDNPYAVECMYFTRSANYRAKWSNYRSGPAGNQLCYGFDATDISGDIFTGNAFTRDFTVQHHRLPRQHADLWQGYGGPPNRILCDGVVEAAAQMIFLDDGREKNTDVAMVNVVARDTGTQFKSQFGQSMRNVLVWHCETNQQLLMKDSDNLDVFETCSFHGNLFRTVAYSSRTRTFEEVTATGWHWSENRTTSGVCGVDAGETCGRTVRWDAEQNERGATTNRGAK